MEFCVLTIQEKLVNFPKVYSINLEENKDRKHYMNSQFQEYGIDGTIFTVERYDSIKDRMRVLIRHESVDKAMEFGVPSTVSYLRLMRYWYENTNQEYAIFCEDDISFSSIENWHFTWNDFINSFPEDFDAIQLIRIQSVDSEELLLDENFGYMPRIERGRWFGASGLFTRKYVKRLLDYYTNGFEFKIFIPHPDIKDEIIENVLYLMPDSKVYNFPLVFEEDRIFKTTYLTYDNELPVKRKIQQLSNEYWRTIWARFGDKLTIDKIWS